MARKYQELDQIYSNSKKSKSGIRKKIWNELSRVKDTVLFFSAFKLIKMKLLRVLVGQTDFQGINDQPIAEKPN